MSEIQGKTFWGQWLLDKETLVLRHKKILYEIYLDECKSSAQILDWIIQISQKSWATNDDIGELVRALDDILNIQGHFCGSGQSHEADSEELTKAYVKRLR
jgi:hypothetical protein